MEQSVYIRDNHWYDNVWSHYRYGFLPPAKFSPHQAKDCEDKAGDSHCRFGYIHWQIARYNCNYQWWQYFYLSSYAEKNKNVNSQMPDVCVAKDIHNMIRPRTPVEEAHFQLLTKKVDANTT